MFAAIYVPDFALQVALRHEPDLHGRAVAVTDDAKPAKVLHRTAAAQAKGVAAGMTSMQALGRCPELAFRVPSPALVASAHEALVQLACAQSPFVESTAQGVCTIDLRSDPKTDYAERAGVIIAQAAKMNLRGRVGVAGNADLALLAAKRARPYLHVTDPAEFLGPLPVCVLAPPRDVARLLKRWGVKTLGALAALPADQLTERLGPEGLRLWELAAGESRRLLTLVRAENTFEEAVEFDYEIETMEPLLFVIRRFLGQISERLELFGLVTEMLDLKITFAQGIALHARRFLVPAPTRDVEVLFRMVHTHLETLVADAPIVGLRVEARACHPRDRQLGLFETSLRNPHQFYETLALLTGLVGADRIGQPLASDSHRPDRFKMKTPEFEGDSTDLPGDPPPGLPLQRCRPPRPLRVAVKQSVPSAIFSEAVSGGVTAARGPWKLSGDWWTKEPWATEEWDVQIEDALYRISQRGEEWHLDGIYG